MTKEELKEAINATIVANGQKGITAESLANLLLEIVDAAGEGGGGSAGGNVFMLTFKQDPESLDIMLSEPNEENALIRQKLIENLNNDVACTLYLGIIGLDDAGAKMVESCLIQIYGYLEGMFVITVAGSGLRGNFLLNEDGSLVEFDM